MHTRIRNCSSIVFALVLAIGSLLVGFGPAVAVANGLPDAACPSNLNSCTASDVKTTVKAVQILGTCEGGSNDGTACTQTGGQCTGGGKCTPDYCSGLDDTIRLRITNTYEATASQRYDLGIFVSRDGGTVQEPSSALLCAGAAAKVGEGDGPRFFLDLDPTGHAASTVPDTCGDLDSGTGSVDWTVDVRVQCKIADDKLIIPSCRVWEQNANHQTSCTDLQQAGTGSKCDCTDLVVTPQLNPCATTICNDNNVCTADSCEVQNNNGTLVAVCVSTPVSVGTVCGEAAGACDLADTCNAAGVCQTNLVPSGTVCRASADLCDAAEVCDGISKDCPADVFKPATEICRTSAGACDVAESCTGTSAACPADTFAAPTTVCRPSAGVCDAAETCTGSSAACPADGFLPPTTTCRESAGACDVAESCTGASAACPADTFAAPTTVCRPSAGVCDAAESCSGSSAVCPADVFLPPATTCRAANGVCDVAESCSGNSAACPADAFKPATEVCRAANGVCDVAESCSGNSAACPVDAFKPTTEVCRAANGVCDVAESCSGNSAACPSDAFKPTTEVCRAANGVCDVAESCSGNSAACPADAFKPTTEVCRTSAGICDVAESCTGSNAECPANGFQPATTICSALPPSGDCVAPDSCDGSGVCAPGGQCDFRNDTQVMPASTTCQQYKGGAAGLAEVKYFRQGLNIQLISSTNPGAFVLYDGLMLSSTGIITVTESIGPPVQTWTRRLPVQSGQIILYDADTCEVAYDFSSGTPAGLTLIQGTGANLGNLTITGVPAGSYILSAKYVANNVLACRYAECPNPGTQYTFSVTVGGLASGSDSILYKKY